VRAEEEEERLKQIQEQPRSIDFQDKDRREVAIKNAAEVVRKKVEGGESKSSPAVWAAVKSLTEFLDAQPDSDSIPNPVLMAIIQLTNYLESEEEAEAVEQPRERTRGLPTRSRGQTLRSRVQPTQSQRQLTTTTQATTTTTTKSSNQKFPRRFVKKFKVIGRGENRELIPAGLDGEFPLLRQFRGSTTTRRPRLRFEGSGQGGRSSAQLRLDTGASPELLRVREDLLNKGSLRFESSSDEKFDVRIIGSEGHLEPLLETAASHQPVATQVVEEKQKNQEPRVLNVEDLDTLDLLAKFNFETLPIRR